MAVNIFLTFPRLILYYKLLILTNTLNVNNYIKLGPHSGAATFIIMTFCIIVKMRQYL
jgi:hypothetical protein